MLDLTRAWLAYDDHVLPAADGITTEEGDQVANPSPVSHIADRLTYRLWQSQSETTSFEIDFGADVTFQALCVVFPRITDPRRRNGQQEVQPTDLIRHRLDADGGTSGTGAVLDTGAVPCQARPDRGYSVVALTNPITARYWRCDLDMPSRADLGFALVSLAFAAPIFQPDFNYVFGERIALADPSTVDRSTAGQVGFPSYAERVLEGEFGWDFLPDDERPSWQALDNAVGQTEPVLFALPDDAATPLPGGQGHVLSGDSVFLGLITSPLGLTSRDVGTSVRVIQLTEHR